MAKKSIAVAGIAILYSLFLCACGSDSTSDNPVWLNKNNYCKVVSKDPLVIEMVEDGVFSKTTLSFKDGVVTETVEFESSSVAKEACTMYKMDSDYGMVTCQDKKITAEGEETLSALDFNDLKQSFIDGCEDYNDEAVSSRESSSSSRIASSSSSRKTDSSSSEKSSSSDKESSSSKTVVVCSEEKVHEKLDPLVYTVGYEFNDPDDFGKEYFGRNDAVVDGETFYGDCDNIMFDGHSCLEIPLSEEFKTNSFFIEARIYPQKFGTIQNIIASEPPGSGKSGWMLRLDDGELTFHVRDAENAYSDWKVFKAKKMSLDEWALVRVEKYASGDVVILVEGDTVLTGSYEGNIVNKEYEVGIGCSAVGQGDYNGRAFIGEMDYVRLGKLDESKAPSLKSVVPADSAAEDSLDNGPNRSKVAASDLTLQCPEAAESISDGYTVAYEFDVADDLGMDFFGNNHAVLGTGTPDGDCSSLVLDGASGLRVPVNDDFRSRGFLIETRFKLTDVSGTYFIAGINPIYGETDGWKIYVNKGMVEFQAVDNDVSPLWEPLQIESINADEWHSVRIKIFPAKSGLSNEVFYTLNAAFDGSLRKAVEFKGNLSQLKGVFAIGYDPDLVSDFVTGEIDYVRFGTVSEEGL